MSSDPVSVNWLNTGDLKSVTARRFADFCARDFTESISAEDVGDFNSDLYKEAARLVIERIEAAVAGGQQ